jgi:hypothetical protein
MKRLRIAIVTSLLLLPFLMQAQQQPVDTLAALKQFLQITSSFKQLPMHGVIQITNGSDLVLSPRDTGSMGIEFYLFNDSAYLKSGEMEQLSNDSLVVIVSSRAKKIMIMHSKQTVTDRLNAYLGIQLADSSIKKMSEKYTATVLPFENGTGIIEVKSRALSYDSVSPKQSIRMSYDSSTLQVKKITQVSQKLVRIDSVQYAGFLQNPVYQGKLLATKSKVSGRGGYYFLVKEQKTEFRYKKLEYGNAIQLPVSINNRIVKSSSGSYIPAQGYEAFSIKLY